jgi:hypothetical protein
MQLARAKYVGDGPFEGHFLCWLLACVNGALVTPADRSSV